jgi:glycosyltransferase involved in cell wall biosynthesis
MKCGCPVAASDIPVHREIFQNASSYFNTYDVEDAAAVLHGLLQEVGPSRLTELRQAGERVSAQYAADRIMPQWQAFFMRLQAQRNA